MLLKWGKFFGFCRNCTLSFVLRILESFGLLIRIWYLSEAESERFRREGISQGEARMLIKMGKKMVLTMKQF